MAFRKCHDNFCSYRTSPANTSPSDQPVLSRCLQQSAAGRRRTPFIAFHPSRPTQELIYSCGEGKRRHFIQFSCFSSERNKAPATSVIVIGGSCCLAPLFDLRRNRVRSNLVVVAPGAARLSDAPGACSVLNRSAKSREHPIQTMNFHKREKSTGTLSRVADDVAFREFSVLLIDRIHGKRRDEEGSRSTARMFVRILRSF